jgi:hypothetical protein
MFEEYERLEAQIERIEKYELPNAHHQGGHSQTRRVRAKIHRLEAALTQLHQQLFPISLGSYLDPVEKSPNTCDRCREYVFRDDTARFEAVGICPRCEGLPLSPSDPNYRPGDTIANPLEGGNTR